jgi:hypothetical protein
MTFLTLFTAPKPFVDPHIAIIQRNALRSWQLLGPDVSVVLHGDDPGVAETAAEFGFIHVPDVAANEKGVPYIDDMFRRTRELSDAPVLAIINTDIILFPDFLETAREAHRNIGDFVLVGRRWDLDITEPLAFDDGYEDRLRQQVRSEGKLKTPNATDYFMFSRTVLTEVPNFTIGRAGWDNWMIYQSRVQPWKILDATGAIIVVHQNHDYSHLPGGQPHYRHPDSERNVVLAGGMRHMYNQLDVNYDLVNGQVVRKPITWVRLIRILERWFQPEGTPRGIQGRIFRRLQRYRSRLVNG